MRTIIVAVNFVALVCAACLNSACIGYAKAGPTVPIVQAITETMKTPSPMSVPLDHLGSDWKGKTLQVSTLPNKDVHITITKQGDGSVEFEYTSTMSDGIVKLFAGAMGLNEAAYTEAGREREFADKLADKMFDRLMVIIDKLSPSSPQTPPASAAPSPVAGILGKLPSPEEINDLKKFLEAMGYSGTAPASNGGG